MAKDKSSKTAVSVNPIGKRGYALTVFRSPKIEMFNIEVIGDLPQGGVASTYQFLARAYGPVIEKVGGVPDGSSGSPVYVGSKLIGAISYTAYPDATLVGVTPIEAMLALEKEPGSAVQGSANTVTNSMKVCASGFRTPGAIGELNKHYGACTINPEGNEIEVSDNSTHLQPGSPIGVMLMTGDLNVGYLFTMTLVKGERFFAVGHPVFFTGPSEIPLATAKVAATGRGDFPFKMASFGHVVGTVLQDRAAGIYGRLDVMPTNLIPMEFTVTDEDRDVTEVLKVRAVLQQLSFLAYAGAYEAMLRAMNRDGAGTANWEWIIEVDQVSEPIRHMEKKYDSFIAYTVANSISPILDEIFRRGYVVRSIKLNATVTMAQS